MACHVGFSMAGVDADKKNVTRRAPGVTVDNGSVTGREALVEIVPVKAAHVPLLWRFITNPVAA
jgi:hypothetical protein